MTGPTHRVKATGELVFPRGYDPAALEPITDQHRLESRLAHVRATRDELLASCDWTQLVDQPAYRRERWAVYRQLLRDFPDTIVDDGEPVWPTPPEL